MLTQKQLYRYNRKKIQVPSTCNEEILQFESNWVQSIMESCNLEKAPNNYLQLVDAFTALIMFQRSSESDYSKYVSRDMSLDEFKVLVQEFAIDGLTEAQVFYYILPRLHLEAQMPMLRIMIDEFGSAVYARTHTRLYMNLLEELSMPTEYMFYCEHTQETSFEFVNIFYWLTIRANDVSYFVGALTYLETIIPDAFECYVNCCHRLKIKSHLYYSEHQHIDYFHAKEGMRLFKILDKTGELNYKKAYIGIKIACLIVNQAFEHAVFKAKTEKKINYSTNEPIERCV